MGFDSFGRLGDTQINSMITGMVTFVFCALPNLPFFF